MGERTTPALGGCISSRRSSVPRLMFLWLEPVTLLGFAWLVFGISIEGSLVALRTVTLLGAMPFGGIVRLVAAGRSR